MTAAQFIEPLVASTLASAETLHVTCWDGSEFGPPDAPARVAFTRRRAIRRLLWGPNKLGFARAYVSGDIQVEGDIMTGLSAYGRQLGRPESLCR